MSMKKMSKTYYGYKLKSMNNSYELALYKMNSYTRPSNQIYNSTYYDVELRWYVKKETMIKKLLDMGFTPREIENAPKNYY